MPLATYSQFRFYQNAPEFMDAWTTGSVTTSVTTSQTDGYAANLANPTTLQVILPTTTAQWLDLIIDWAPETLTYPANYAAVSDGAVYSLRCGDQIATSRPATFRIPYTAVAASLELLRNGLPIGDLSYAVKTYEWYAPLLQPGQPTSTALTVINGQPNGTGTIKQPTSLTANRAYSFDVVSLRINSVTIEEAVSETSVMHLQESWTANRVDASGKVWLSTSPACADLIADEAFDEFQVLPNGVRRSITAPTLTGYLDWKMIFEGGVNGSIRDSVKQYDYTNTVVNYQIPAYPVAPVDASALPALDAQSAFGLQSCFAGVTSAVLGDQFNYVSLTRALCADKFIKDLLAVTDSYISYGEQRVLPLGAATWLGALGTAAGGAMEAALSAGIAPSGGMSGFYPTHELGYTTETHLNVNQAKVTLSSTALTFEAPPLGVSYVDGATTCQAPVPLELLQLCRFSAPTYDGHTGITLHYDYAGESGQLALLSPPPPVIAGYGTDYREQPDSNPVVNFETITNDIPPNIPVEELPDLVGRPTPLTLYYAPAVHPGPIVPAGEQLSIQNAASLSGGTIEAETDLSFVAAADAVLVLPAGSTVGSTTMQETRPVFVANGTPVTLKAGKAIRLAAGVADVVGTFMLKAESDVTLGLSPETRIRGAWSVQLLGDTVSRLYAAEDRKMELGTPANVAVIGCDAPLILSGGYAYANTPVLRSVMDDRHQTEDIHPGSGSIRIANCTVDQTALEVHGDISISLGLIDDLEDLSTETDGTHLHANITQGGAGRFFFVEPTYVRCCAYFDATYVVGSATTPNPAMPATVTSGIFSFGISALVDADYTVYYYWALVEGDVTLPAAWRTAEGVTATCIPAAGVGILPITTTALFPTYRPRTENPTTTLANSVAELETARSYQVTDLASLDGPAELSTDGQVVTITPVQPATWTLPYGWRYASDPAATQRMAGFYEVSAAIVLPARACSINVPVAATYAATGDLRIVPTGNRTATFGAAGKSDGLYVTTWDGQGDYVGIPADEVRGIFTVGPAAARGRYAVDTLANTTVTLTPDEAVTSMTIPRGATYIVGGQTFVAFRDVAGVALAVTDSIILRGVSVIDLPVYFTVTDSTVEPCARWRPFTGDDSIIPDARTKALAPLPTAMPDKFASIKTFALHDFKFASSVSPKGQVVTFEVASNITLPAGRLELFVPRGEYAHITPGPITYRPSGSIVTIGSDVLVSASTTVTGATGIMLPHGFHSFSVVDGQTLGATGPGCIVQFTQTAGSSRVISVKLAAGTYDVMTGATPYKTFVNTQPAPTTRYMFGDKWRSLTNSSGTVTLPATLGARAYMNATGRRFNGQFAPTTTPGTYGVCHLVFDTEQTELTITSSGHPSAYTLNSADVATIPATGGTPTTGVTTLLGLAAKVGFFPGTIPLFGATALPSYSVLVASGFGGWMVPYIPAGHYALVAVDETSAGLTEVCRGFIAPDNVTDVYTPSGLSNMDIVTDAGVRKPARRVRVVTDGVGLNLTGRSWTVLGIYDTASNTRQIACLPISNYLGATGTSVAVFKTAGSIAAGSTGIAMSDVITTNYNTNLARSLDGITDPTKVATSVLTVTKRRQPQVAGGIYGMFTPNFFAGDRVRITLDTATSGWQATLVQPPMAVSLIEVRIRHRSNGVYLRVIVKVPTDKRAITMTILQGITSLKALLEACAGRTSACYVGTQDGLPCFYRSSSINLDGQWSKSFEDLPRWLHTFIPGTITLSAVLNTLNQTSRATTNLTARDFINLPPPGYRAETFDLIGHLDSVVYATPDALIAAGLKNVWNSYTLESITYTDLAQYPVDVTTKPTALSTYDLKLGTVALTKTNPIPTVDRWTATITVPTTGPITIFVPGHAGKVLTMVRSKLEREATITLLDGTTVVSSQTMKLRNVDTSGNEMAPTMLDLADPDSLFPMPTAVPYILPLGCKVEYV